MRVVHAKARHAFKFLTIVVVSKFHLNWTTLFMGSCELETLHDISR